MQVYIIFLKDEPYATSEGSRFFTDYKKAENYMNNAIRNVGRVLYSYSDNYASWYDIGEESKQKWFNEAKELLTIKTFKELN